MCWILLVVALTCVLVGWLAQSWKQRTGALWGLLTFLDVLAFLLLFALWVAERPRLLRMRPLAWSRLALWSMLVALGVGLVMTLVVATLPTSSKKE